MKELAKTPLTGDPVIDKHLLARTPLYTMIDRTQLMWMLEEVEIETEKLYEILNTYYDEKQYIDNYNIATRFIKAGIKLDYYLHAPNQHFRKFVAEQGHGLDKLVHDPSTVVRCAIVRKGWCLETLKHDKSTDVRLQVVKQNYDLEFFLNDTSQRVAKEARKRLEKQKRKQLIDNRKARDENNQTKKIDRTT